VSSGAVMNLAPARHLPSSSLLFLREEGEELELVGARSFSTHGRLFIGEARQFTARDIFRQGTVLLLASSLEVNGHSVPPVTLATRRDGMVWPWSTAAVDLYGVLFVVDFAKYLGVQASMCPCELQGSWPLLHPHAELTR
jgi:hypothetical protein